MQQINLYLPEFQPNREPLRSVQMLWGLVAFIVLLAIVSLFSAQENQKRELALEQSRVQLEQLKNQLAKLEQQRPTT
ncbi:MAG: MSHA biogenesis protein MshI, partial [Cellvibrio sp.]